MIRVGFARVGGLRTRLGFPAAEERAQEQPRQYAERHLISEDANQEAEQKSEKPAEHLRHGASMARTILQFKRRHFARPRA